MFLFICESLCFVLSFLGEGFVAIFCVCCLRVLVFLFFRDRVSLCSPGFYHSNIFLKCGCHFWTPHTCAHSHTTYTHTNTHT
ncbi:hypothetical protein LEMLEM_LOCUS1566, partial [Lemmus lemmus]